MRAAFDSFGIDPSIQSEVAAEIEEDEGFKSWVRGKFGIHRPQSNYAPLSARFTPATYIGLAIHYWQLQGRQFRAQQKEIVKEISGGRPSC